MDWRYWLVGRIVTGGDGNLGLFGKGFGIDAAQSAASGYNAYQLSSGLRSIGINYNYRHYINDNWQIYGEALYEHYSSEVRDSPIARSDYEAEVGIGFIYVF